MEYGTVEFITGDGRTILLTLVSKEDEMVLFTEGVTALRRKRLLRLVREAKAQNYDLSLGELSGILMVSKSTICRDINYLKQKGLLEHEVSVGLENGESCFEKDIAGDN
jgi:response regulator of citrate/malate metabolism